MDILLKDLKSCIKNRNIKYFVHFTKARNLFDIRKYGLLSSQEIMNLKHQNYGVIDYNPSDWYNFYKEYISLSVSFPNYKMLYKKMGKRKSEDWCVLVISPKAILDKECYFFEDNAASFQNFNFEDRNTLDSFESMFSDFTNSKGEYIKRSVSLREDYPTSSQAEILVKGKIDVKYIKYVCFKDLETAKFYYNNLKNHPEWVKKYKFCSDFFKTRGK